jgi:hypothetical protein
MFKNLWRPSPALVLAFVALLVAMGGTAYAATSIVNLADPTTPANKAKVDATGHLYVGDGAGRLSVDGTVTAQPAPASAFYHHGSLNLRENSGCVLIATPPAGKALVVRQARVNVLPVTSPGPGHEVVLWASADCNGPYVGRAYAASVAQYAVIPFDPGLGIPAGSALSAQFFGSAQGDIFVDGFTVASSLVPGSGASGASGAERQRS